MGIMFNLSRRFIFQTKQAAKSDFFRSAATLFSGTALAQIIPFIITPILTRIYLPSDYGVFAVFMSITTLCAVIATFRYDNAILLPADEDSAIALAFLCGFGVLFIASVIELLIYFFYTPLLLVLKNSDIGNWVYLVPLYVIFIGWNNTLSLWLNRRKQYRKLAINRVSVAVITAMSSLAFAGLGYAGLILAAILGQIAASFIFLAWVWQDLSDGFRRLKWAALTQIAKSYKKFPLLSLPSDAINTLSQQIPVLMLSRFFGASILGSFSFSQRVLGMPISLLSQPVCDVFKQRASADYRNHGNCSDIFNKTSKMLAVLSIVPLIVVLLFAPLMFKILFGKAWEQAGQYTRYLAPLYIFRFIVSPLSYIFYISNRQDADLLAQIGLLFISIVSMIFGIYIKSPDWAIVTFSFGYIMVYCFYFFGARNLAKGNNCIFSKKDIKELR